MFVWLASYPKSGNTWMRAALWSLQHGGAPIDLADMHEMGRPVAIRHILERVLGVESSDLTREEIDELRPIALSRLAAARHTTMPRKVHDAWRVTRSGAPLFPPSAAAGAIYMVRDPRAVVPSFAHHSQTSIDTAIDFLANADAWLGNHEDRGVQVLPERLLTWSAHVESWLDHAVPAPEVIRYEDMIENPALALERAARVLGWSADAGAVERAVAETRFEKLRAAEDQQGFREGAEGAPFFRRGTIGGWREELSTAQVRRIERDHGAVMRRLGYL